MITLPEWLTSINSSKVDLILESDDKELAEKEYVPFLINRLISYHADGILYVNEMNQRAFLDGGPQYKYLLHSLRSRKRFGKWQKTDKIENLELIKDYFNYSDQKAKVALNTLQPDQIEKIKNSMQMGGKTKK